MWENYGLNSMDQAHIRALFPILGDHEVQSRYIQTHYSFLLEFLSLRELSTEIMTQALKDYDQTAAKTPTLTQTEPEPNSKIETERLAKITVLYLARIAYDDFWALITLAGSGKGFSAMVMLRSLYERVVTANYIAENPSEASNFIGRAPIELLRLWKRTVEALPRIESGYPPDKITDLERRSLEAKAAGCTANNLEVMAKKLKDQHLFRMYGGCYTQPTFYAHAHPLGLEWRLSRENGRTVYRGLSEEEASRASAYGHGLFLSLLIAENDLFKLGLGDKIKQLRRRYGKIWAELGAPKSSR